MRYEYWVVRFVPDPVREEQANIGVIAGVGADWAYRAVSDLRRAARLGGSTSATPAFFQRIERAIEVGRADLTALLADPTQGPELNRGTIEELRVRMNNIVQISPPRPMIARSAVEAAALAFELMVVDTGHEATARPRTRVLRRLQRAFEFGPDLSAKVLLHQRALVGRQETSVDVALASDRAELLSQAWAFDLKQVQDLQVRIQAWNYLVGRIRDGGGRLRSRAGSEPELAIPPDVRISVLFAPPKTSDGAVQLSIAREGWAKLGVESFEEERARDLVDAAHLG